MQHDESATVIGESLLITGELSGKEDMTVLGRVEGSIRLAKTLFVATDGIVKADVDVGNAVISGIVVGNVTASESVQITETGRLVGDLHAPRIVIVAGARVRGQVDMREQGQSESRESGSRQVVQGQRHASQSSAQDSSTALARAPSGRFQRLGLPQRRPMPVAPTPVRRTNEPAKKEQQEASASHDSRHAARSPVHAAASKRSVQSKRRSHNRRRD